MNRNVFLENAPSLRFHVLSFPWVIEWVRGFTNVMLLAFLQKNPNPKGINLKERRLATLDVPVLI
jgi:hypothetical protein